MADDPLIGLICDHTSPVLAGDILRAGYRITRVEPSALVEGEVAEVDAWVLDCENPGAVAEASLWLEPRLLALSNRPAPSELEAYRAWGERIIATLDKWTAHLRHPDATALISNAEAVSEVEDVWLLVGSTGAFGSVSRFLASFTHIPRLAFVYAQHIDPRQQSTLTAIRNANRALRCTLALGRHWLNPGQMLIVPASSQLRFGRSGEVFSSREGWPTPETPSIDSLALAMAGMRPAPAGALVFSGAGRDGSKGLAALAQRGTQVWVQDPDSCEAPSMPAAAIECGLAQVVDGPEGLAARLMSMYETPL